MSAGRRVLLVGFALVAVFACRSPQPLPVVGELELDRYLGRWYEIASFPQRFQKGCFATTAWYERRPDGGIRVVNSCRDGSFDGDLRRIEGVAWLAEPESSPAKLKVQFFWPIRGDYWVIDLDPEYRTAAVGHPSRDYLWILSREPTLEPASYEAILARVAALGFDVDRLERTPQLRGDPER